MNPSVVWGEGGNKWGCNLCGSFNTTPAWYVQRSTVENSGVQFGAVQHSAVFVTFFKICIVFLLKLFKSNRFDIPRKRVHILAVNIGLTVRVFKETYRMELTELNSTLLVSVTTFAVTTKSELS